MSRIFRTSLAEEVWRTKYQYKNESPLQTFRRVAKAIASVEKNPEEWEEKFLKALVNFNDEGRAVGLKCTMGGRITANLGTRYKKATLMNCYINGPVKNAEVKYNRYLPDGTIIPIKHKSPDTGDNMTNIMLTLMEQTLTLGREGGWGINAGFIRPRGSLVGGIGVEHPGVVKFLEMFDKTSDVVVAGNNDGYKDPISNHHKKLDSLNKPKKKQSRKGAMLAALRIDHPDIQEYILAKQEGGKLTKFNLSILITDEFLHAVEKDEMFELTFEGKIIKKVRAVELYDLIMKATYGRNEPGVLFYDNMQKNNPFAYAGDVTATNPCGEIPGIPDVTTVCLLGSINVTQYVNLDRTFDWDRYEEDIATFARMLDNICDLHKDDLPSYLWAVKNVRQYGMGVNGVGSAEYMLGIRYGSEESDKFVEKLNWRKMNICLETSALLAKEKGAAPAFSYEYYETEFWREWSNDKIDPHIRALVRKYGVRNLKQTTNPPLGNTSILCDVVSNGVEPVFMEKYERTYITEDWPEGFDAEQLKKYLTEQTIGGMKIWKGNINGQEYYYEPHNRGLCKIEVVYDYGYKWLLDNGYPIDKKVIVTTNELTTDEHINTQALFQKYIDQSVSKTINIPNDYPYEEFKQLYLKAWKLGLNGVTTYRSGTMEEVLSKVGDNGGSGRGTGVIKDVKLPNKFMNGPTEMINREGQKFYIHFSYMMEDLDMKFPIAMWIQSNQKPKGEAIYVNRALKSLSLLLERFEVPVKEIDKLESKYRNDWPYNKLAKAISMCLRHNLPLPNIVAALQNLEGDNISTLLTAVRKFLSTHIKDGTEVKGSKCEECGGKTIYESGCVKCLDCGSSNCG